MTLEERELIIRGLNALDTPSYDLDTRRQARRLANKMKTPTPKRVFRPRSQYNGMYNKNIKIKYKDLPDGRNRSRHNIGRAGRFRNRYQAKRTC